MTELARDFDEVMGNENEENEGTEMEAEFQENEVEKDEVTLAFESWLDDEASEDEMIESLHNEFELSYPSAVNKLRALRKAAGLLKPRGHTGEQVRQFIKEQHEANVERADIIKALAEKFGYTDKSAASTYSTQAGKLGLTGEGGAAAKHPLNVVVAFARKNQDKKRADFVEAMQEELSYSPSTAGSFFSYLAFAQEYTKQEKEGVTYEDVIAKLEEVEEVEEVEDDQSVA